MKKLLNFFEIPAKDFQRAVNFYEELLGIELKACDCGKEKMAFFPEKEFNIHGAISFAKDFNPSKDGSLIYFNTNLKLDLLLQKLKNMGGDILKEKTKIEVEGGGYFALVLDSEGNRIGLYEE